MKRRRQLLAAALICATLLLLVVALLHAPPVRRFAVNQVRQYLLENNQIDLEVASFRYNLLTLSAELRGVVLRSVPAAGLPPLLEIGLAHIDVDLPSLLRGRLRLEEGRLDGVRINLVFDESGHNNLPVSPEPADPEEAPGLPGFLVESLEVRNGSFSFDHRARQLRAELPAWSLEITGKPERLAHEIRLESRAEGSATFEGRVLPVRDLRLSAELRPDAADLRDFLLVIGNSRLETSGSLGDFAKPEVALTAAIEADVKETTRWAGLGEPLGGELTGEIRAEGPLDGLRLAVQMKGTGLAARGFGAEAGLDASWDQSSRRLELRALNVRSPSGTIRAQGSLALTAGAGESRIQGDIQNLDLQHLTREFHAPVRLASRLTASLRAHWEGTGYEKAEGSAAVRLVVAAEEPAPGVLPVAGALRVTGTGEQVTATVEELTALGSRWQGAVQLGSPDRLGGSVHANIPDVARLAAGLETFLGQEPGSLTGAGLGGSLQLSARLGGTLNRPEASLALESPALDFGRIKGATLTVESAYSPETLRLEKLSAAWGKQELSAQGVAGLGAESPTLDFQVRLHRASLTDIVAALGQDLPVEGAFTGEALLQGTADRPSAKATLSAGQVGAYGEDLGTLALKARLDGERIELDELKLEKPDESGILRLAGSYDLTSQAYTLDAMARNLSVRGLTLPDGVTVRGTIDLSASGRGTPQDPSLSADLRLAGLEIAGRSFGDLNTKALLDEGTGTLEVDAPKLNIRSQARVQLAPPHPAELTVTAENTDLSLFDITLSEDERLAGQVTLQANASGDLADWRSLRASATIGDLLLKLRGQEIRSETPVQVAWREETLHFTSATIAAGESKISISGSVPAEGPGADRPLRLEGDLDIAGLLAFLPPLSGVGASGKLGLSAEVLGSFERLDPRLRLETTDAALVVPALESPVAGIALDLGYEDGLVTVRRLEAEVGRGIIRAQGRVPLGPYLGNLPLRVEPRDDPARFAVEVSNLELAAFPGVPEDISGSTSLSLEGELPHLGDWTAVEMKGKLEDLQLQIADYKLRLPEPATLSASGGVARIDRFLLTGPETRLEALATAGLQAPYPLDVRIFGDLDAAALTMLSDSFKMGGKSELAIAVSGTTGEPQIDGYFEIPRGRATLPSPRVSVADLDLRIALSQNEIAVERLTGTLNGGKFEGAGSARFGGQGLEDFDLKISTQDAFFEFPEGLETRISADLQIHPQDDLTILGGTVRILEGSYRKLLELEREAFEYLETSGGVEFAEERNPFLQNLRFNIAIETESPLVVENNLMDGLIQSDLELVGTYYRPALTGRLTIEEGAEIYLNERRYLVERGVVTFTNMTRIEPTLDIVATTQASGYDIELRVEGQPGETSATFSSEPPLSEPDIVSVLVTGRTLEQVQGAELNVAKEQVLSYLSGRAASRISRRAEETLGLSTVRIDPSLISAESDPGARLTLGQQITDRLSFIYSMNLVDSADQIQQLEYSFARRFTGRSTRQEDNTYRFDFDHDLRWGGPKVEVSGRDQTRKKVGAVTFEGEPVFTEETLRKKFKLETGDKYDFFRAQKSLDRLQKYYTSQERLESTVRAKREQKDGEVDLTVTIDAGPMVEFEFTGFDLPGSVRQRVRKIWSDGFVDSQRTQDCVLAIRNHLVEKGFLEAEVLPEVGFPTAGVKRVTFAIEPGVRYEGVELVFEGASALSPETLREALKKEDVQVEIRTAPQRVIALLTGYCREQGYLGVKVDNPRYELEPDKRTGRVVIPIEEGPLYRVGSLTFKGNNALQTSRLLETAALNEGQPYRPDLLNSSIDNIEQLYWTNGYNNVEITYTLAGKREQGLVNVAFEINEHQQQVVSRIDVEGTHETSEKFVRSQLSLAPGEVLNYSEINRTRKNLYNTGAYSLVDIQPEAVSEASDFRNPQLLRVKVREIRPFNVKYGAFYDTDRGPGFIADLTNRNTLGSARVLGFRTRYDPEFRELRGYLSQPLLRRWPIKTNFIGFTSRENREAASFITDRTGFSVNQEVHLWGNTIISYGYRFERTDTFDKDPDSIFQVPPFNVAPLTFSWSRETRDEILDATRGSLFSHAFEYAPSNLGSDLQFIKYFGQYFKYVGLTRPAEVPFSGGLRRPRVVYAGGVRVGLGKGLGGQNLVETERFFAGGGTTLRGFEKDTVGPSDFLGPTGGDAVFITNNEIRFPLFRFFDGVGFLDMGNVYQRIGDFDPLDLRKSAGFGLRVRTPYFLLRLDYGFILGRKPDEPTGGFFFSIGQAF